MLAAKAVTPEIVKIKPHIIAVQIFHSKTPKRSILVNEFADYAASASADHRGLRAAELSRYAQEEGFWRRV